MDLSLTALIISTVVGFGLPVVSSYVTNWDAPPELAGLVTVGTSVVTGAAAQLIAQGSDIDWKGVAATAGTTYLAAAQARARIWLDSALDAKALAAGNKPVVPGDVELVDTEKNYGPQGDEPDTEVVEGESEEQIEGVPGYGPDSDPETDPKPAY